MVYLTQTLSFPFNIRCFYFNYASLSVFLFLWLSSSWMDEGCAKRVSYIFRDSRIYSLVKKRRVNIIEQCEVFPEHNILHCMLVFSWLSRKYFDSKTCRAIHFSYTEISMVFSTYERRYPFSKFPQIFDPRMKFYFEWQMPNYWGFPFINKFFKFPNGNFIWEKRSSGTFAQTLSISGFETLNSPPPTWLSATPNTNLTIWVPHNQIIMKIDYQKHKLQMLLNWWRFTLG